MALILSVALLGPAVAQEKTPLDPFAGDARLQRRVAVTAEGIAVGELIEQLSRKTGIALAATRETADDKVILFGPARPLREVLEDLAALFDDRWERKEEKDGTVRYLLGRSARARQLEAQLVRTRTEHWAARFQEHARALAETPATRARRPKEDPIRARIEDPDSRLGLTFYTLLSARQREVLFDRGRLTIPFPALTEPQKEPVRKILARRLREHQETVAREAVEGFTVANPGAEEFERGVLQFVLSSGGISQLWLVKPGFGTSLALLTDWNTSWVLPPHGDPYTRAPVPRDASLPPPAATRTAAAHPAWPDRLRHLAEGAGIAVMSDFYRSRPVTAVLGPAPGSAKSSVAALDALCHPEGYLWWTRGKTVLLRKRDWFLQNRREVPDRWFLPLAARLQAQAGRPTRGDLLSLRELTTAQIAGLGDYCGPWGQDERDLLGLRELLTLLANSPTGQSAPLHAGMLTPEVMPRITLTRSQLTPRQRLLIPAFLAEAEPIANPEESKGFSLRIFCTYDQPQMAPTAIRYHQVIVEYHLSDRFEGSDGGSYRVMLPMALPDDRRDRTKIEVSEMGESGVSPTRSTSSSSGTPPAAPRPS